MQCELTRVHYRVLLKAGMLESRNTKTQNLVHTYDARISISTVATTATAKASLVLDYFYSKFYSLPKNFWFRPLLRFSMTSRDQKKPVSTIFLRNLEMKSPTAFCLAEVSDSFALIEVLFHRRASIGYTTFPSL